MESKINNLYGNVLITGTSGFIGGYLKNYMNNEGVPIWGTVRSREPQPGEYKVDLTRPEDYKILPKNYFSIIIHNAGILPVKNSNYTKRDFHEINAKATKKLLNWAKLNDCQHFIHISSIAAYGLKTLGENRTEKDTKRTKGLIGPSYNCSKANAESYVEKSGINYTILRLPSVLGANDTMISDSIIPLLKRNIIFYTRKKNPLFSTLFIKNLGPIIKKVIEIGPLNDVFNCTDYHIKWSEFVEEFALNLKVKVTPIKKNLLSILTHLNNKNYLYVITNSYFGAHFPNSKLLKTLVLNPEFSWKDGVKESIMSYHQ